MNEEISAAVKWWAEQLQERPVATSGDSEIDMWFVLTNRGCAALDQARIKAFQTALSRLLTEHLSKFDHATLSTDYGPEDMLKDALVEAKINNAMSYLPMKTIMWVRSGGVGVKCGYGAREEVVYQKEDDVSVS